MLDVFHKQMTLGTTTDDLSGVAVDYYSQNYRSSRNIRSNIKASNKLLK